MPFDGSGNYVAAAAPNFPAVGGATIASAYYNATINDIVTALNNCVTRDGQGKVSANIDWNAKNLTNVAAFSCTGAMTVGGALTAASISTTGTFSAAALQIDATNQHQFYNLSATAIGIRIGTAGPFGAIKATTANNLIFDASSGGPVALAVSGTIVFSVASSGNATFTGSAFIPNTAGYQFTDVSGSHPFLVCQNDNNFVFYGTDAAGGQKSIFSILMRNTASVLNFTLTPVCPTAAAGTADTQVATTAFVDRLRDIPANIYTVNHAVDASHRGGGADFNGANLTATIAAGLSDGYTALITNLNATNLTIASASDVLTLAGTTTTGNRTLVQNGMATVRRVNGILLIGGNGLS